VSVYGWMQWINIYSENLEFLALWVVSCPLKTHVSRLRQVVIESGLDGLDHSTRPWFSVF